MKLRFIMPIRKKEATVCLGKGEMPPAVTVSDFCIEKVLFCIFFDALGPVAQIHLPKGQTLAGNFYTTVVLQEV